MCAAQKQPSGRRRKLKPCERAAANEAGLRALAVEMLQDAVQQVQKGRGGAARQDAIDFLRSRGAGELMEALNINQGRALKRLGIEKSVSEAVTAIAASG